MPVLTNVVEIVMQETLAETSATKNCWNVFHYQLTAGTLDAYSQLLGNFESTVYSFAVAQQSADTTLIAMLARLLDDATQQYTTITTSVAGGVALPRLPGDLSVVLPYRCSQRGKQFRGRKHFRGVPSASVLKDELTAAALTAWQAVAAKMLANFTGTTGTYTPVVVSKTQSQLKTNPTTIIGSVVNAVLTNKTIGTFRRSKEKTQR